MNIRQFFLASLLFFLVNPLMAQKRIVRTDKAPVPIGPYSQAVAAHGTLYVAGQIGIDPATGKLVEGGTEQEMPRIMENIKAILAAQGMDLTHIVNTTVYITDLKQFGKVNALYASYFTGDFPARTTVGVSELPAGASLEVAVVAAVPNRKRKK